MNSAVVSDLVDMLPEFDDKTRYDNTTFKCAEGELYELPLTEADLLNMNPPACCVEVTNAGRKQPVTKTNGGP